MLVVFINLSRELSRAFYIIKNKLNRLLTELSDFEELITFILTPIGNYSLVAEYKAVILEAGVRFSLAALFNLRYFSVAFAGGD